MKRAVFIITWLVFHISCMEEKPDLTEQNPRIKQALEQRKSQYISTVLESCKAHLYQEASEYVDSLVASEISFQLSDSIVFPPRPLYPGWPGPVVLKDPFHVSPLFINNETQ